MNSEIKAFGFSLVAVLTLTAVMASAASAQFTSSKLHTTLTGSQKVSTNEVFSAGGFNRVICENATFKGTFTNTSEETMVLTPAYSDCEDSFGNKAHITANTLEYTFTSGVGANGGTKGDVDIKGEIVFTVTASTHCTITIKGPQTNNGITYTNLGGTSGFEVTTHTTNLQSTTSGGFVACGVSDGGHGTGTIAGTVIITGKGGDNLAAELKVD
jgi:hypothetical protein